MLVQKYMKGETKLDDYVTHTMNFDQINDAFDLLHKGDCLRCVLSFDTNSKEEEVGQKRKLKEGGSEQE